ncbi:hypothetical protein GBF38_011877, partial [Nibea albiflora]
THLGGYGGSPYGDSKSSGKYGYGRIPHEAQAAGLSPEAKSAGKYGNNLKGLSGPQYQSESAGLGQSGKLTGEYDTAGLPYEPLPLEPDSAGKSYVVAFPAAPNPSPTLAYPSDPSYLPVESSFTPDVAPGAGAEDLPDRVGTASLALDSAPATEIQGAVEAPEQPDDPLPQQLPRQIHIQQHLKLHFHQQGKSWRG